MGRCEGGRDRGELMGRCCIDGGEVLSMHYSPIVDFKVMLCDEIGGWLDNPLSLHCDCFHERKMGDMPRSLCV
jgi:hypothetical protein